MFNKGISECNIYQIDQKFIKEIFEIVGGVPRYIFNSDSEQAVQNAKKYIQTAISNSNITRIFGDIDRSIFSEEYSSSLVRPVVNKDLQLTGIDFVSHFALVNTCIRHKETLFNNIRSSM